MSTDRSTIDMAAAVNTAAQHGTPTGPAAVPPSMGITRKNADGSITAAQTIQNILGDVTLSKLPYRNLDLHESSGHTTTGLPYPCLGPPPW